MAIPRSKEKEIARLEKHLRKYKENPKLTGRIENKIRSLKGQK